jgi:hypothetical protein
MPEFMDIGYPVCPSVSCQECCFIYTVSGLRVTNNIKNGGTYNPNDRVERKVGVGPTTPTMGGGVTHNRNNGWGTHNPKNGWGTHNPNNPNDIVPNSEWLNFDLITLDFLFCGDNSFEFLLNDFVSTSPMQLLLMSTKGIYSLLKNRKRVLVGHNPLESLWGICIITG